MDPPWPNKSVKRLRSYNTFQIDELFDLPIESLCHTNTFVIIWLTNNSTVHSSIEKVLESWDLKLYRICHWLKITKNYQPITPFESTHKVPYESFLIALPSSNGVFSNRKEIETCHSKFCNDFCFIRYVWDSDTEILWVLDLNWDSLVFVPKMSSSTVKQRRF